MKDKTVEGFGSRLRKIRKGRGMTQIALGEAVGVSNRVIHYYEEESSQPPGAILVELAQALGVSTDELLGVTPVKEMRNPRKARLLRRLERVADLPPSDQRTVLKFVDALVENRGLGGNGARNGRSDRG